MNGMLTAKLNHTGQLCQVDFCQRCRPQAPSGGRSIVVMVTGLKLTISIHAVESVEAVTW